MALLFTVNGVLAEVLPVNNSINASKWVTIGCDDTGTSYPIGYTIEDIKPKLNIVTGFLPMSDCGGTSYKVGYFDKLSFKVKAFPKGQLYSNNNCSITATVVDAPRVILKVRTEDGRLICNRI